MLEVPLLVRVADKPPTDDEPRLRTERWDEASEYLRVVRWAEFGAPYHPVYVRVGELPDVRIGHRSIVDAYDNSLDADHFQWGVHGAVNTVYGGTEALIDEVADPDVMALRLYVRPLAFGSDPGAGRRLAVGVTLAGDQAAPTALRLDESGTRYASNSRGDLQIEATRATGLLGWDVEYALAQGSVGSVTPYADVVTHLAHGTGFHVGAFFGLRPIDALVIDARAEYRALGGGYLPAYIGRLYEVERRTYLPVSAGTLRVPKLTFASTQPASLRHGYAAEVGLNILQKVTIAAGWEDMTGPNNNSAWAQLRLPPIWRVQAGATYVNTRFHRTPGLFDLSNALAAAELRFMLLDWLYIDGALRRRWEVDASGDYVPVDDWWAGAGVSFGF